MKGFDYSKVHKEKKIYDILRPLGKAIIKSNFKVKYVGQENIPEEGGFILASNHIKALDPLIISIGVKKRQLHFMAKKELFEKPFVGTLFKTVNGFPIVRGGADKSALTYAERVVMEGHILGIFPEGTRSKDHKPASPKSGVAVIANKAKADILPVALFNDEDLVKGSKLTVRFGKVIPYESLGINEDSTREEIKNAAQIVMDEIIKLWEMGHCE